MATIQSIAPVVSPTSATTWRPAPGQRPALDAATASVAAAVAKPTTPAVVPTPAAASAPTAAEKVTPEVAPVTEVSSGAGVPPEGYLPSTMQVLSQLTPADRAAIAGVTGYHLSPSGEITNPGGLPPWSFILAFAEGRRADRAQEAQAEADAAKAAKAAAAGQDSAGTAHVDVVV
jgi:hypothetical protein